MRRKSLIVLLGTITLSVPSSVLATSERCRTVTFDTVWKAKVAAIKAFNKAHPDYVKRHNLTRDMSASTRRLKEQARKSLELQCVLSGYEFLSQNEPITFTYKDQSVLGNSGLLVTEDGHLVTWRPINIEIESAPRNQTIPLEEYPVYDNPGRSYWPSETNNGSNSAFNIFPVYFGGGGYPAVNNIGIPPANPTGPTIPLAPTPEPSYAAVVAFALVSMIRLKR